MRGVHVPRNFVPVSEDLTEQLRFVASVKEGLADADADRLTPHAEVVKRMRVRFDAKRK